MRMRTAWTSALVAAAVALSAGGCGSETDATPPDTAQPPLPENGERVTLDPEEFTTRIDNPYWPMTPGNRWVYEETEAGEPPLRVVVTVTERTKRIANGIEARVVRDVVTKDGVPVEVTDDWYAQDGAGNVWYLGEDTAEYRHGEPVNRAGSFEAGVDGAQAGVAMPAAPEVGLAYRQEYYAGEAEDAAVVLSLDEQVGVPAGHYTGTLMTKDLVPLEPTVSEHKFYARGIGPVLALGISGGAGREELVSFRQGR